VRHIAIQEQVDGNAVNWMEKISDEQYGAKKAEWSERDERHRR
jgi:hypothetical protein